MVALQFKHLAIGRGVLFLYIGGLKKLKFGFLNSLLCKAAMGI